jgi:hypothetical protein
MLPAAKIFVHASDKGAASGQPRPQTMKLLPLQGANMHRAEHTEDQPSVVPVWQFDLKVCLICAAMPACRLQSYDLVTLASSDAMRTENVSTCAGIRHPRVSDADIHAAEAVQLCLMDAANMPAPCCKFGM